MHNRIRENEDRRLFRKECIEEGRAEGIVEGEDNLTTLLKKLRALGRLDDIDAALDDSEARNRLYKEFGIC